MREILVAIHAGAGVAGLVVGLAVFRPPIPADRRLWWRIAYGGLLVVMVVSLVALIAVDWPELPIGARMAFSGLAILGVVILARMAMAYRLVLSREPGWQRRYVGHVYFTYVSLWVGFAIVPALRSPDPILWIPVSVIGVLTVGWFLLHRYESAIGLRSG